jgi:hypothetical protein
MTERRVEMSRAFLLLVSVALVAAMMGLPFGPSGTARAESDKVKIDKSAEYDPVIEPADFEDADGNPLPIDNPYLPLVPGTTFIYEGETEDGIEHNEVYVTHQTTEILGVTCTVVLDTVEVEGELVELTFDWFAQDFAGNVWYFGEYSEEYEDGEVNTEGSWEAGVDGAKPGIVMLADPIEGSSYRQEYYEDVAEDMGKVLKLNAFVSVLYGDFAGCLATKEWTPLEPGAVEHKYYAPGVGLVLVMELTGGQTVPIELIDITTE